jgi:hypothetical protein
MFFEKLFRCYPFLPDPTVFRPQSAPFSLPPLASGHRESRIEEKKLSNRGNDDADL